MFEDDKKPQKTPVGYLCKDCDFKCSNKKDFNRHLLTAKHQNRTSEDIKNPKKPQKTPKNTETHVCECGKEYKYYRGLWQHKKTCTFKNLTNDSLNASPPPENKVVQEGMNESIMIKCFQTMMEAQAAEAQTQAQAQAEQTRLLIEAISLNGMQCITNNNTTNNQFNLNVFLNEDCKDAYTLKEVADSIECTVSDLDRMDHDGYVATVTRKILESIQDMEITERPIHCTDARRNTVCVKNETGWEKNDKAMKLLTDSVYFVGRNLGGMIQDWQKAYPDHYHGTESRRQQYHRLVDDAMNVIDKSVEAQIASKVCKGVILDRKTAKK